MVVLRSHVELVEPAGRQRGPGGGILQERIDEARQRARAACDSIELPR